MISLEQACEVFLAEQEFQIGGISETDEYWVFVPILPEDVGEYGASLPIVYKQDGKFCYKWRPELDERTPVRIPDRFAF